MRERKPDYRDRLYAGAHELFPGFYVRPDGSCIFNAARFHKLMGFGDTPADREETFEMVKAEIAKLMPGQQVVVVREGHDEDGRSVPVDDNGRPV